MHMAHIQSLTSHLECSMYAHTVCTIGCKTLHHTYFTLPDQLIMVSQAAMWTTVDVHGSLGILDRSLPLVELFTSGHHGWLPKFWQGLCCVPSIPRCTLLSSFNIIATHDDA